MKLAIIGSGNVGKGLGAAAVKAGHDVSITSRSPEHYREAAREIGAAPASVGEAVQAADLIVIAVSTDAVETVGRQIAPAAQGKPVVDVSNRANFNDPGSVLDGSSAAESLQAVMPEAKVVKAFNTIFAGSYPNPNGGGQKYDTYLAGDDDSAKAAVGELASSIGLRPLDVGPLVMGRVLEGMALINMLMQVRNGWPWLSGFKVIGPTGEE